MRNVYKLSNGTNLTTRQDMAVKLIFGLLYDYSGKLYESFDFNI